MKGFIRNMVLSSLVVSSLQGVMQITIEEVTEGATPDVVIRWAGYRSMGTLWQGRPRLPVSRVGFLLTLPEGDLPSTRVKGLLVGPDGFFDPDAGEEVTGLSADGEGVTETVTMVDGIWEEVTFTAPTGSARQIARLVVEFAE